MESNSRQKDLRTVVVAIAMSLFGALGFVAPLSANDRLTMTPAVALDSESTIVSTIELVADEAILGFSFAISTPTPLEPPTLDYIGPSPADFVEVVTDPGAQLSGITVVLDALPIPATIDVATPSRYPVVRAEFALQSQAVGFHTVLFSDAPTFGDNGVFIEFTTATGTVVPDSPARVFWVLDDPVMLGLDNRVYIANYASATLSIFDLTGLELVAPAPPTQAGPVAVAVDAGGVVWVVCKDANVVQRFDRDGNELSTTAVDAGPHAIAIDRRGFAWIACEENDRLDVLGPSGQPLWTGASGWVGSGFETGHPLIDLAMDPVTNAVYALSAGGAVIKFDSNARLIAYTTVDGPKHLVVDPEACVWVTTNNQVVRFNADLNRIAEYNFIGADPRFLALSWPNWTPPIPTGEFEVWVSLGFANSITRIGPDVGVISQFPVFGHPGGLASDGEGGVFVVLDLPGKIVRFDKAQVPLWDGDTGTDPRFLGDATGVLQAGLMRPREDFDGDSSDNLTELTGTGSPFDAAILPAYPPVQDLACWLDSGQVVLNWSSPFAYDAITVLRDGVFLASIAGSATSYSDAFPPDGFHVYTVTASATESTPPQSCQVSVGIAEWLSATALDPPSDLPGGTPTRRVYDIAVNDDPDAFGGVKYFVSDPIGLIYGLDAGFEVVTTIPSPILDAPTAGVAVGTNDTLFVAAGPNGDPAQQARIVEISFTGEFLSEILLEDDGAPVLGGLAGIDVANPSLLIAVGPETCELFSVLTNGTVVFRALHPTAGASLNGVQYRGRHGAAGADLYSTHRGADGRFQVARLIITESGGVGTVTSVTELYALEAAPGENAFGGFVIDQGADRMIVAGISQNVLHRYRIESSTAFVRGDANVDLVVDISDAILILLHLFQAEPIACNDAADANDDGTVDVSDVIYLLAFAFVAGAPTIPEPYPELGLDPTDDGLGCGD